MSQLVYRAGRRAYYRINQRLTPQPTPLPPKLFQPHQKPSEPYSSISMVLESSSQNGPAATSSSSDPMLVRFYSPVHPGKDPQSRTLSSILAWTDSQLEFSHDYIQVLFPLPEGSLYNFSAPLIDSRVFAAFRSRPDLQASLKLALERMLRFYGFELRDDDTESSSEVEVVKLPDFSTTSRHWVQRFNHNHLRITRIIRSLRVLGLEREAKAFFLALRQVYDECNGRIGQKSMLFWSRAASRPLFLAPDDEEDDGNGAEFLYQFERQGGEAIKPGGNMKYPGT